VAIQRKKKQYTGASKGGDDDIQIARIPFIGDQLQRSSSAAKDQRFVNGFFDVRKNKETQKSHYFFVKRPGTTQTGGTRPPAGNATGRGCYSWNGKLYSVFGTKIYSGTTDLGVTLKTTTGLCGFAETRAGIGTQYLGINDGINIYLITLADGISTISVKADTITVTIATPGVVSWATHGLVAGSPVVFNTTGALPTGITAGTTYYVSATGLGASAFQIAATPGGASINTTGTQSGTHTGTLPTTRDLEYMDGYFFTLRADCVVVNCSVDDPTTWAAASFLTAQMYGGVGIGLKRQNNLLVAFLDRVIQFFYDAENTSGSPLANVEQACQQMGCASHDSIAEHEGDIFWVTNHNTVAKLTGVTSLQEIQTPNLQRLLDGEGTAIASSVGYVIHVGGRTLYILNLSTAGRTFVYDIEDELWFEWEAAAGGAVWPIVAETMHSNVIRVQHASNGWLYVLSTTVYQDDAVSFTVLARLSRVDFDTMKWKFCKRVDLIGDKQASTTNVSLQYSDDDYGTLSTARTFDMAQTQCFGVNFGRFQRRGWQVSYAGANPLRLEGLELRLRIGDS